MSKILIDEAVVRQVLEALENSVDLVREDAYEAEKLYGRYPTRQGKVAGLKVLADDHEKAITALRLEIDALNMASKPALAEQHKPYRPLQDNGSKYFGPSWDKADEALNKPQKRPQNCGTGYCSCIECVMEPAQEPAPLRDAMVANLVREGINKHKARELADHFVGLATAPTWVSLTDEEIDDIYQGVGRNDLMLVREVEAELRKKNHA